MRRIFLPLFFLIISIFCTSCKVPEDNVLNSLGEYKKHEYYSEGEFQDYTDYAKYYYESANLSENSFFTEIQETDLPKINEHLDDFEAWIDTYMDSDPTLEIVENYDFNRDIIDNEDYIYIDSEKQTWDDGNTFLVNYNLYFFDTQTQVLYYFHNNT